MLRSIVFGLIVMGAAEAAQSQGPASQAVKLAPHRVVYDLSLVSSRGLRGIEGARGRIVYEFSGNACDGYNLKFRQVTLLQSQEGEPKVSDLRSANSESGDGKSFRFRSDNATEGSGKTTVDGQAERRPGSLSVRLRIPARQAVTLPGDAVFPNVQMKDIIAAAREGRRLLPMRVFDGSDNGRKVYDTLAVIGSRIEPGGAGLEEPARQAWLAKLPRWPVSVSYFDEGKGDQPPIYVLSFDLYDNGISRALKLDYGDFVLKGDMARLDALPVATACQR